MWIQSYQNSRQYLQDGITRENRAKYNSYENSTSRDRDTWVLIATADSFNLSLQMARLKLMCFTDNSPGYDEAHSHKDCHKRTVLLAERGY